MRKATRIILGLALAAGLTLPIALTTSADPREDCHRRLEADRARIDRDSARHGDRSPQVSRDIDRMEADRQWCREHKAEWDHDRFDVGIYLRK